MNERGQPTAITVPPAPMVPGRIQPAGRTWNTLQRLLALRGSLLLASGLLLVLLLATAQGIHEAARAVATEEAPSLVAAEQVGGALSAMNAAFAAHLLSPAARDADLGETYNADRTEVVRGLIHAAQHLSRSGADPPALETLEEELGEYERLLQRSRDLGEPSPAAALPAFHQATTVLDTQLQPAAADLAKLAGKDLEAAESAQSLRYTTLTALRVLLGLMVFSLLMLTQVFLSRRTHRTFNLPLLAATLLLLAGGVHLTSLLTGAESTLLQARSGALADTQALLAARSAALAANDQGSRALLDRSQAHVPEQEFFRLADQVATLPPALPGEQLLAPLREGRAVDSFTGSLAQVTEAARTNEERAPALAAVAAWQHYNSTVRQAFRLEHNGQSRDALLLETGTSPGSLPSVREELIRSLDTLLAGQQEALAHQLRDSEKIASTATAESCFGTPLLMALVFWGFAPRVREYQARD